MAWYIYIYIYDCSYGQDVDYSYGQDVDYSYGQDVDLESKAVQDSVVFN